MHKYTQQEFDAFKVDRDGRMICPTGDYTAIRRFGPSCAFGQGCAFGPGSTFGQGCAFGQGCDFGQGCAFGQGCDFGQGCAFGLYCDFGPGCSIEGGYTFTDTLKFEGFGRQQRCTYFWLLTDGTVYVRCGCFAGTLEAFRAQIIDTHGNNKHGRDYLAIADLVVQHWGLGGDIIGKDKD